MARHKEFDKEAVLEQAMLLFWRQGYEATSIRDLMEATGISSSSLYESFGDKRAIYLAALRRYSQLEQTSFQALIEQHQNLKLVLAQAMQNAQSASAHGFFSMNSIVEFGNRDSEITAILWEHYQVIWENFRDALVRVQGIEPEDAGSRAHTLIIALYGYVSMLRVKPDFADTEGVLRNLQALLD